MFLKDIYELKHIYPKLYQLRLLSERTYRGKDFEKDILGKVYELRELQSSVQCSDKQLSEELQALGDFQKNGFIRILDSSYKEKILDLILSYIVENGWKFENVKCADVVESAKFDYEIGILNHVISTFSSKNKNKEGNVKFNSKKIALFKSKMILKRQKKQVEYEDFLIKLSESLLPEHFEKVDIKIEELIAIEDKQGKSSLNIMN